MKDRLGLPVIILNKVTTTVFIGWMEQNGPPDDDLHPPERFDLHVFEIDEVCARRSKMSSLLFVHVVISLFGIVSGFVVVYGFLTGRRLNGWTAFFLATTIATSVSGFALPAAHLMPSHILGVLSLITLSLAVFARYFEGLKGKWNDTFVVNSLISQYFNVFVLVTQLFQKVPSLKALAPTQTELPFALTHLVVLAAFVVVGVTSVRRLRVARLRTVLGMITF